MSKGNQPQHGHGDPSTTLGIGEEEAGQDPAGPASGSQRETGGSGGDELTGNQVGENAQPPASQGDACNLPAEELSDGAVVARGATDTRSDQAGWSKTGLGTPETGGNQNAEDLERHRKPGKK